MKQKLWKTILGAFDLVLSFGAIGTGVLMVQSSYGVFTSYPEEWLSKLPFDSWFIPGILAIVLFGGGNLAAAIFSFVRNREKAWRASAAMGTALLMCITVQVILFGEWYLASIELLLLGIVQLCLSAVVMIYTKKASTSF